MFIPTKRLLIAIAVLFAAAIGVVVAPDTVLVWIGLTGFMLAIVASDAFLLARTPAPEARRTVPATLALGVERDVRIRLINHAPRRVAFECYDHHPVGFEIRGMPQSTSIAGRAWVEFGYAVRPVERGDHTFEQLEVRISSPIGLWQRRRTVGEATTVRVYPNFAAITKYTLLATDNRLSQIGILQRRRRGEGLDFHQLREYRRGDTLRQIDWKATARTEKTISREYQDERNQQVMFLLDCGRRMTAKDGPLSHFDHMLNATLLLAYVALRQGDAVGFMTMGTDPTESRFMAPRKSGSSVNMMLAQLYDLQPTLATSDYQVAATEFMKRINKRTLVVVLTNLRDEDDDNALPALRLMRGRHLVLFASLREQLLSDLLAKPIQRFDDALAHGATAEYMKTRERAFARLAGSGAITLDVEPDRLAVQLVNRYLDVKRSGRL